MTNVIDIQRNKKRFAVSVDAQERNYSKYGFCFDAGKLDKKDTELIMILLTVGKLIDWNTCKNQIREALINDDLKDWVIQDILMKANEVFFDKKTIAKTMKNIYSLKENELMDAFTAIVKKINY